MNAPAPRFADGLFELVIPMRTVSEANTHEHWSRKAARQKQQRAVVGACLRSRSLRCPLRVPLLITLTRIGPGKLDTMVNLPSSMKATEDAIAEWIGIDDRHDHLVAYQARQERRRGDWYVRITIERRG